jgi:excisionase family DNA binding protein
MPATPTTFPAPPPAGQELLTTDELARLLGVTTRRVWLLRGAGNLPAPVRLGPLVRWRRSTIDRWLSECPDAAPKVDRKDR